MEICRHGTIARKCETCEARADAAELRAELAKVTAERDEARDEAETWRRYAHIEDRGYLREVGAAAEFPWERATPTEGDR